MPRKKALKGSAKAVRGRKPAAAAPLKKERPDETPSASQAAPGKKSAEPVQLIRGMRDILPADEPLWSVIKNKAAELSHSFGYGYIETPVLEHKALFVRGMGTATDVVQKEMYTFKDQGGDELGLRPEGTAAVARAYISHGMLNLPQPVKLWYLGPFFRHEKPQAGRYRQFHQWGIEVLGDAHPVLDAEVISIAMAFFQDLKIPTSLRLNSIGCGQCRPGYVAELLKFYAPKRELLCESCKARLETNPLRLLDCKEPQCELLKEGTPQTMDALCEECRDHFMRVLEYLDELAIVYQLDPYLVRGLDYYTRTVFEIFPSSDIPADGNVPKDKADQTTKAGDSPAENLGSGESAAGEESSDFNQSVQDSVQKKGDTKLSAQSALGSGGRYDGLIEQLGGRPAPGVGFSLGLERIVNLLREAGAFKSGDAGPRIFVAQLGEGARRKALALWHALRKEVPAQAALSKDGLKAQLEIANRLQVRYAIIIGQKELLDSTAIIRDMEAGMQEVIDYNKVVAAVKKKLE